MNVLCTFKLCPVSTGKKLNKHRVVAKLKTIRTGYRKAYDNGR